MIGKSRTTKKSEKGFRNSSDFTTNAKDVFFKCETFVNENPHVVSIVRPWECEIFISKYIVIRNGTEKKTAEVLLTFNLMAPLNA